MKFRKISIRWRIFFSMIGFCLVLLGILWAFQIVFLEASYKMVKTYEIRADARAIGSLVVREEWDQLTNAIGIRDDLYVEIWPIGAGSVIVTENYRGGIQFRMSHADRGLLFMALSEQGKAIISRHRTDEVVGLRRRMGESILYSDILSGKDGKQWMMMVSANISPVGATVDTLRYQIYAISIVMLAAAVTVALTLSRLVIRPIERLNSAAGELAKGNYNVKFEAKGYKEIVQLADTLTAASGELGKTEGIRRELIANVSHDLRTPLTLITGYGEMMRDIPGENTPENMSVIVEESKRLASLVNDMLDLSKLQSGMMDTELAKFSLTRCVDDIIARFAQFTEQEGYTIIFEAETEVAVLADKNRISQVIYNFLSNAIHYTGQDKKVIVRQFVKDNEVIIQVIDTGDGIDADDLLYVWDRYFKVDKVHRRAVAGTGLGLSIAKSILTRHEGARYGVESKSGSGSCFWFALNIVGDEL